MTAQTLPDDPFADFGDGQTYDFPKCDRLNCGEDLSDVSPNEDGSEIVGRLNPDGTYHYCRPARILGAVLRMGSSVGQLGINNICDGSCNCDLCAAGRKVQHLLADSFP